MTSTDTSAVTTMITTATITIMTMNRDMVILTHTGMLTS